MSLLSSGKEESRSNVYGSSSSRFGYEEEHYDTREISNQNGLSITISPQKLDDDDRRMLKKMKNQVFLEGYYVDTSDEEELGRTKSLTDEDLDELKGCLDLGFGFNYDEIPELCNTLPALELCYSMNQRYLDEHQKSPESMSDTASSSSGSVSIPNWKISSPGDDPEDVKARLKYWAQAVVCTVRLCN